MALRYVADLTERQVAEVMGISRGTVASTLSDARRRLADDLATSGAVESDEVATDCDRRSGAGERCDGLSPSNTTSDDCEVTS